MSKTIIVDGNSIGYAAQHATKLNSGEMETQAVFGSLKTMRELRLTYYASNIVVLWDGVAQWRYDIHPEYKSNRTDDPKKVEVKKAYYVQREYIKKCYEALGIRQMTASTHEADDLAGILVGLLTQVPENEIVLISGDRDWIQLVKHNVTWRDLRDDSRVINSSNFFDKTAYKTPYAFLEGKALQGDNSDCISGVGGIGEKGAPELLAEFCSVRNFWKKCDTGEFKPVRKPHIRLCSAEGRMIFGRNLRLMQLLKVPPPKKENVELLSGNLNKEKFVELCEELAFGSILKNVDAFIQDFKE